MASPPSTAAPARCSRSGCPATATTQNGIVDPNYDPSDPLYLTDLSGGYFKLTGCALGRFEYLGHGRFHFAPTLTDEDVTVFDDGKVIIGPESVKGSNGFANLKCSASSFASIVTVPYRE
ncbi:MAG: hypothetical protein ACLP8S_11970 [Solirubrobacteraceae bacterium]